MVGTNLQDEGQVLTSTVEIILSCRALVWEGALGRHKIEDDYGTAPQVAPLDPLSLDDARSTSLTG